MRNSNVPVPLIVCFCVALVCLPMVLPGVVRGEDQPRSADAAAEPEIPWELEPYRVRVEVGWEPAIELSAIARQQVLADCQAAVDRVLGEQWQCEITEQFGFSPMTAARLSELKGTDFTGDWLTTSRDKSFLAVVGQSGPTWQLSVLEWDHAARDLSPVRTVFLSDSRELGGELFRLLQARFRPLLKVDDVGEGEVLVRVRGASLLPADPDCVQMAQGRFWRPFYRFRNKDNAVEKLQAVPWTWLRSLEPVPETVAQWSCETISGLRMPLTNRRRPRIDLLALAVEPEADFTRLTCRSVRDPERALIGLTIEVRHPDSLKRAENPEEKPPPTAPPLKFTTDREGSILLDRQTHPGLHWLYVRSGQKLLARLPVVPGMEADVRAELPDYSLALSVIGELSILESRLTDTVAQRAVLMAQMRRHASLNQWNEIRERQKDLRRLPTAAEFLRDLTSIRIPAVQEAQRLKDRGTAATIERLCKETSVTIQKFLDADKLREFEAELKELEREVKSSRPAPSTN